MSKQSVITMGSAALIATIAIVAVIMTYMGGGGSDAQILPIGSEADVQSGGGAVLQQTLPPDLKSIRDNLPNGSEAASFSGQNYGADILDLTGFASVAPTQVMAFYQRELTKQGWVTSQAPTRLVTDPTNGKFDDTALQLAVARGTHTITIIAVPSDKDPKAGITLVSLRIQGQ